ncbi:MAG: PilZ domain-containing protein [Porticoccaceae bacterium]|nr:PilZ domain-containing protein [Porticoccaceae bacterium]
MTSQLSGESRLERRLPGLDTSVKIRRRGFGFKQWCVDLDLVDISANGMAVDSPHLRFQALQKVDFQLSSGEHTSSGCAVVCYAGNDESQDRYGFLFIDTDAEFQGFLTGESLSLSQIKRLGEELAEQFMQKRKLEDGKFFNIQNQRMVDAVSALAQRLGQMGLYIIGEAGEVMRPVDSLVVGKNSGLSLPMKDPATGAIVRANIALIQGTDTTTIAYEVDGGSRFDNIIDLLDHICLGFEQISQP